MGRRSRFHTPQVTIVAYLIVAIIVCLQTAGAGAAPSTLQLAISAPATGTTLSGSVSWIVSVSGGTTSVVYFSVDGSALASDTSFPYETVLDTTKLTDGTHTLTASAPTNQGKGSGKPLSASVNVTIANGTAVAPSDVALPTISGSAIVGQGLSASTGTWAGTSPLGYGYQWRRCDPSGASCSDIGGANTANYIVTTSDQGTTVRVTVTATNNAGTQATTSSPTAQVQPPLTATASTFPAVGVAAGADMQNWTGAAVAHALDDYVNLHAHWIRHDFAWDAIEPQQGSYAWTGFDQLVSAARSRGINVIATVTYTPAWANGGHTNHNYRPTSADAFGRFAGEVAARYAPEGVHTYEIWNEPNIGYWLPTPDPAAYTQVLCAAYKYIHAADAQATVITGGTSPAGDGSSTYSPQTWLSDLYANGAQACFDAVGHHPYVDAWSNWDAMATYSTNLRQIEVAHGDGAKRIWATEVGCNRSTLGDSECSSRISQAFQLWKSYSWAGALTWFTYWDPNVYGLVDGSWAPRPEWYAYQQAAAAAFG